ncbi:MAG: single-stranded-DNA-specific exonuclease RecJ [Bacteroidetes bacterium]|nr:single-stranded-DNA-specific exonuclease RecJ [Bacteroidota bacterium]MCB0842352.1 single-stranded-DNA-specific exonuclease RecJ [Bacteroidota bacterium]
MTDATKWIMRELPPARVAESLSMQLSTQQPFPLPLANILAQRGIDSYEAAQRFYSPDLGQIHDPFLMKDMEKAVERIIQARKKAEKILLYGDYDVDGTSAVSLLTLFFSTWGFTFEYYIPDRYKEGYGLSYQGIDYADQNDFGLIITLDCGIKATDKVQYAAVKGIDLIICDHHQPGEKLPEALAVLDPKREDCEYPYKELTGCGVGFKLIQALSVKLPENGFPTPEGFEDPMQAYADLVTLSIACDIVPITGENRVIAFYGLKKLKTDPLPGIKVIMDQDQNSREWGISDLVFFVGPRINAAGRLGDAKGAVEVMLGESEDLISLADALQNSNDARKDLDKQMTDEALMMIDRDRHYGQKSTTVLYNPKWHKGVIGIVASRLIERYYRPTVLLTESDGKLVGSARSVVGFDLYQALEQCNDYLIQFGGHKYAAGLTLKESEFTNFAFTFDQIVGSSITPEQRVPVLYIDHLLKFSEIDARFIRLLNRMEPFGPGNRKPVFMTKHVKVLHTTIMKETHVRLVLQHENIMLEAVGFNLAEKLSQVPAEGHIDIAYQPVFNTWNQNTRINLRLKDFRPSYE